MAPGTDEAQRQRELTKQALEQSAGKLEQRVRAELDWKARLRRDGPRYAAIAGGAIVLIGTLVYRALDASVATRPRRRRLR